MKIKTDKENGNASANATDNGFFIVKANSNKVKMER